MVDKAQLLKGVLEGCILEIISKEETYGYEITEKLNAIGFESLNEGSVYPVLMRLSKKGYVISHIRTSTLGPKRKYFEISNLGQAYLINFKNTWSELVNVVQTLMQGGTYEC